ncbi:uncharacterized protein LOC118434029 [Folsomia candida]|uniref:ACB domain-containing protein n=1 Tax=Folsomia candida TaxID=158441 RepID=A0A226F109_FOLCA|nr:uncharacterized protein LOC118434029 [Folsomia candida]OXA62616.1 hypothetical protein Fcan01_01289 [Folsomia candida]
MLTLLFNDPEILLMCLIVGLISCKIRFAKIQYSGPKKKELTACATDDKQKCLNFANKFDTTGLDTRFKDTSQVFVPLLNPDFISSLDKIRLYSLYKQATCGNCPLSAFGLSGKGGIRGKLYWLLHRGMTHSQAKIEYIKYHAKLQDNEKVYLTVRNYAGRIRNDFQKFYNFEPVLYPGHIVIPLNQLPSHLLSEYNGAVKTKYMGAWRGKLAYDERAMQYPRPISDSHFISIFTNTQFCKLVTYLDPDKQSLTPYLKLFGLEDHKNDEMDYFIADLTGVLALPLRKEDNCVLCPSVALFKRGDQKSKLCLVSIAIENLFETASLDDNDDLNMPPFPNLLDSLKLVHPGNGVAWELCKLHSALNANYISSLGLHTVLHVVLAGPISLTYDFLNNDTSNFGSRSIIRRIIGVHSFVHSAVDANAFDFNESVVFAEGAPYYAWMVGTSHGGVYNMIRLICDGWRSTKQPVYDGFSNLDGNLVHKENEDVLPFRKFVNSFLLPITKFVAKVLHLVRGDESEQSFVAEFLTKLGDYLPLNSWLRGEIHDLGGSGDFEAWGILMQKLLTYFIFNAVEHSIEHFMLGTWLLNDIHAVLRYHERYP